jgi:hypothetical protein
MCVFSQMILLMRGYNEKKINKKTNEDCSYGW